MNAMTMKRWMLWYLLNRRYNLAAVTEYGGIGCEGIADVFSVSWQNLSHEFEIKCSASDLFGELRSVELLCKETLFTNGLKNYLDEINAFAKLDKHCRYLDRVPPGEGLGYRMFGRKTREFISILNRFSFVVTPDLETKADLCLRGTPYGLMVIQGDYNVQTVKRAEYLHKEKVSNEVFQKIVHKSCTENYDLRIKLSKYGTTKPLSP